MKLAANMLPLALEVYKSFNTNTLRELVRPAIPVFNAGSNKSIRASVTLNILDNNTAVIKIQQPAPTELFSWNDFETLCLILFAFRKI